MNRRNETLSTDFIPADDDPYTGSVRLGATAVGIILGADLLLGGGESVTNEPNLPAATEIAQRFDCHLESVVDTHRKPANDLLSPELDPTKRTTLKVSVALSQRPEAQQSMEQHAHDGSVRWSPPEVGGAVSSDSRKRAAPRLDAVQFSNTIPTEPRQTAHEEQPYPRTITAEVYPKITYSDGQQAKLFVSTAVEAAGPVEANKFMQYNVRGYVDCGTIEFDAAKRTWNVAPDAEIDAPVTEAKRIEFSDPDHDSVFHPE